MPHNNVPIVANPKNQTEYTVKFVIVKVDCVPLFKVYAAKKMGLLTVYYADNFNANVDNFSSKSIASNSPCQQAQSTAVIATAKAPLSVKDK